MKVARWSCVLTVKGLHEQTRLLQLSKQREHELESMREAMQETLMNHKREVLMEVLSSSSKAQHPVDMLSHSLTLVLNQHKVESTNLQAELARVEDERSETEGLHRRLLQQVGELEGTVRMLESELREHSKTSAIDADGKVNVAHTRKKKRLDGDTERAIDRVTTKREQLTNVEKRLAALNAQREEKEEAMREIESTLVGVLVQQQRQLMRVLHSVPAPSTV